MRDTARTNPADELPDFGEWTLFTRDIQPVADRLSELHRRTPDEPTTRGALWKLHLECVRNSYELDPALPLVRPSADEVAAELGCLQALREAGLTVVHAEELSALEDAWLDAAYHRQEMETPLPAKEAPGTYPRRFRLLMQQNDEGAWSPAEVLYERRTLECVKLSGFSRGLRIEDKLLEELTVEDLPFHTDHHVRLLPKREAPAGQEPEDLLRGATPVE